MSADQALQFLSDYTVGWAGYISVTAFAEDCGITTRTVAVDEIGLLRPFIESHNGKCNMHFGVNPLATELNKKAAKSDIAAMAFLHADLDPVDGCALDAERERIKKQIDEFPIGPTLIIDSGGGFQVFWRLHEPVPVNSNIEQLESYNRGIAALLGADHCWNLDRLMRLPGTVNLPNAKKRAKGRRPAPAKLMLFEERAYWLADFDELLAGAEEPQAQPKGDRAINVDDLPISDEIKRLIREGDTENKYDNDRSKALYVAEVEMIRADLDDGTIIKVLLNPEYALSERPLEKGPQWLRDEIKRLRRKLADRDQADPQPHQQPGKAPLFASFKQLCARSLSDRWLVKGLIPAAATGILFGESGTYKSFIALDLALHIAHGLEWCGRKSKQGTALYIAGEGGGGICYRIEGWYKDHGLDSDDAPFRVCTVPLVLNNKTIAANVKVEIGRTAAEIGKPQLIIVDTLSQNYDGDENDSGEMATFFRNLVTYLRDVYPGCSVLIVHHPGHSAQRRPRGSSTILANTDFVFCVNGEHLEATLTCDKMKDAKEPDPLVFTLNEIDLGVDEDDEPLTSLVATFKRASEGTPQQGKPKAGRRKPSKHVDHLITALRKLENPIAEHELRGEFYKACGDEMKPESKCRAFGRALADAVESGLIICLPNGLLRSAGDSDDESCH